MAGEENHFFLRVMAASVSGAGKAMACRFACKTFGVSQYYENLNTLVLD